MSPPSPGNGGPGYRAPCNIWKATLKERAAAEQELREMAIRGVDGPGLHILDVVPWDYEKLEG